MCIDVATFLSIAPEFSAVGGVSSGTITWLGVGVAGQTIAIGGLEFVAVAGARTAGSLTWSVDGSASAQASSFVAAVADSEAVDTITATKTTPTTVRIVTLGHGVDSELYFATSTPATYQLSGATLDGGSDVLDFQLATACTMINASLWGSKAGAGQAYLTAHFMAIATGAGGGETGVTTSRTIDRISQGNAATSFDVSDAAFASTKWGRMYLALKKTIAVVPATTGARGWCIVG